MAPRKGGGSNGSGSGNKATTRSRWATRKLTVKSSNLKRLSLMGRTTRSTSDEKKRTSGATESLRQADAAAAGDDANADASNSQSHGAAGPRKLFFNLPLPDEFKDDDGSPVQPYARNKIRTAKYTPLSFVPKNLWFQFHNIANIFFLFLVILVVCHPAHPAHPVPSCPTLTPSTLQEEYSPSLLDLPYIRWRKPRVKRSSFNCHHCWHWCQGRYRGL